LKTKIVNTISEGIAKVAATPHPHLNDDAQEAKQAIDPSLLIAIDKPLNERNILIPLRLKKGHSRSSYLRPLLT
jgi:hypothetical protein